MPASSPLRSLLLLVPACSLLWLTSGCSSEPAAAPAEKPAAAESAEASAATETPAVESTAANESGSDESTTEAPVEKVANIDPKAPFELGNALEKFDPPTLEELDKLKWNDGRIADGMTLLREEKAGEPAPTLTAEEAQKLRNDSPENNEKILAALGVLQPEGGEGVNFDAKIVRHAPGDLTSTNPLFASSVTDAEFGDLTGIFIMQFDRQLQNFAPKEVVVSWSTLR